MFKEKRDMKIMPRKATIIKENYALYGRTENGRWYLLDVNSEVPAERFEKYYQSKQKKGKK